MRLKSLFTFILLATSTPLLAEANYSLACSMSGNIARVFACNSGTSSEGNNHYVSVSACRENGSDCDDDYDLMYIYSATGGCEEVGRIEFDEAKAYCVAAFRP